MATNFSTPFLSSRDSHLSPNHHHSGPQKIHSLPEMHSDHYKTNYPYSHLGIGQRSIEDVHSMPTHSSRSSEGVHSMPTQFDHSSTTKHRLESIKSKLHQDSTYKHQDSTYKSNEDCRQVHTTSFYSSSDNADYRSRHRHQSTNKTPNLEDRSYSEEIISKPAPKSQVSNSRATIDVMSSEYPVRDPELSHSPPRLQHHILPSPTLSPSPPSHVLHLPPAPSNNPQSVSEKFFSSATLENERYSMESIPRPDHHNEDRFFSLEGPNFKVFGIFDGHDGDHATDFASDYMMELFYFDSWRKIINSNADIAEVLREMFLDTEREFFKKIQSYIEEKESLQRMIPPHLTSYAAYLQYPREVSRLQEVEPMLSGGCTVVLATMIKNRLYVANVGDSRVILVRERPNGTLEAEQLSVDHSVDNKEELERLKRLGLDTEQLVKSGRLGMQENTRSIGDYSIKQGYKDVDSLRSANSPPGIATPYIMPAKEIDGSFKYLVLMTDGVYKSIESTIEDQESIDVNKVFLQMMNHSLDLNKGNFLTISDKLLERIARIHLDSYQKHAKMDPRSPMAVSCRKRDDMTLLVYRFPESSSTA